MKALRYLVEDLDLEAGAAYLREAPVDYYTQARQQTQVDQQSLQNKQPYRARSNPWAKSW
jgi:hypothetical protein